MSSEVREALNAVGAAAITPKVISRALLDYQRRYAPVIAAIPTVKWEADVYYFAQKNYRPNGGFVTDGGARAMSNSQYVQTAFPMKHTQIIGGVTGYAAAVTSGQLPDLLGKEVEGAIQGMYWDMEAATIWGSSAATVNGAYPQYDGFDNMVSTFSGSGTNAVDINASLSLGVLDKLADTVQKNAAMNVFNSEYMFVMSTTAESRLAQLLIAQQRYNDRVEVAAGLLVPTYRNIPIMVSSFLGANTFVMGTVTGATSTTGGFLPATSAYIYQVSAVIHRQGEVQPSAEVTVTTGTGSTGSNTLSFSIPTGNDGLGPMLFKVYRTAAGGGSGTETLLGIVDATVGLGADGVTPIATTSIIDTGVTLIPQNGGTQPAVPTVTYAAGNVNKRPPAANQEPIYLVPRNEDFLVRPYVREAERLPVATTVLAPDTLPFAIQTDSVVALRAPKYMAAAFRVDTHLV